MNRMSQVQFGLMLAICAVGCGEVDQEPLRHSVRQKLGLDHVVSLPRSDFFNGTIVELDTTLDRVNIVCQPESYVDIPKPDRNRFLAKNDPNITVANSRLMQDRLERVAFSLEPAVATSLGVDTNTEFVAEISLTNGRIRKSLIEDRVLADAAHPRNPNCASSVRTHSKLPLYVITEAYVFDLSTNFHSTNQTGLQITARLRAALAAELSRRAGFDSEFAMTGEQLVFGLNWKKMDTIPNREACQPPYRGNYNIKVEWFCQNPPPAELSVPSGTHGQVQFSRGHIKGPAIKFGPNSSDNTNNPVCPSFQGEARMVISTFTDSGALRELFSTQKISTLRNGSHIHTFDIDITGTPLWLYADLSRVGGNQFRIDYDLGSQCDQ